MSDTGERTGYEREIARLNRLYAALSHVNQRIVRQGSRYELLARVCQILVDDGGLMSSRPKTPL